MKEKEKMGLTSRENCYRHIPEEYFSIRQISPSTGFAVVYDGMINDDEEEEPYRATFLKVVDYCPMIEIPNVRFYPMDDSLKNLKEVIGFKYKNNLNG